MKVKVINRFIDKYTKVLNECGSVIDVTEPRFNELSAGGYVKEIEEKTDEQGFNGMTLAELKAYAKEHNIKLGDARTKNAIIDAITDALI